MVKSFADVAGRQVFLPEDSYGYSAVFGMSRE
jgi:hypothetical protein